MNESTGPLMGAARLALTTLHSSQAGDVTIKVKPLTPDQGIVMLANWAAFNEEGITADERTALFAVAPMVAGDELVCALRIAEAEGQKRGFTILLRAQDFAVIDDQMARARDLFEAEGLLAPRSALAAPVREGRGAELDRRPGGQD